MTSLTTSQNLPAPQRSTSPQRITTDVLLIGAGIMSATLGTLLRSLESDWSITVLERLDESAQESSDPWNNAGTGHSALCELNYTPQNPDGSVDISKALKVNEQFQLSRQFWSYEIENGRLSDPSSFINPVPHVSFVHGADRAEYLRKRYEALAPSPLFEGIEYIDDHDEFARRLPLMAEGRRADDKLALNWSSGGTDVDFGSLTGQLLRGLTQDGAEVLYRHEVRNLSKQPDGSWRVKVRDTRANKTFMINAKFVFVGAGGGALPLLQHAGIDEIKGFGGFPVSGQFLKCTSPELAAKHEAKVYGMAAVGAPPMSVPHLDTRVIDGERSLLFGPYAGWTPKFLKEGSLLDLPTSIRPSNLLPMLNVGLTNGSLLKYLITEVLKTRKAKLNSLGEFAPTAAESAEWELITAGQRVQVIRKNGIGGSLEFGTTVVAAGDGSIAGLLGASPGASTAVAAMLDVLERCFSSQMVAWQPTLKEIIPSYGINLNDNPSLLRELREHSNRVLKLDPQA